MTSSGLTHFDEHGASRMVDVAAKPPTPRRAVASGRVRMNPTTLRLVLEQRIAKGDVFEVARLAGIMAAKKTAELIPLCHPLALTAVELTLQPIGEAVVEVRADCRTVGPTGVEMEALTAVAVACLTFYDMCKSVDRAIVLGPIQLEYKTGGKSGEFERAALDANDGT